MTTPRTQYGLTAKAVAFAANAHDGQLRKGTKLPYIVHPMEAMTIAATLTDDPEILAAAVLHDVLEDCGVSEPALARQFGMRVARIVRAVSEEKETDTQGSWQKRKLHTINRMRAADEAEKIVTLADKLSNLRSMDRDLRAAGPGFWQRFNQTNPSMHKWYFSSIAGLLVSLEDTDAYREYVALIDRVFEQHAAR